MQDRALYSIQARKLLGGVSRNTICHLLRTGQLASVPIGSRLISAATIADLFARSTTTVSPSRAATRRRPPDQGGAPSSADLSSRPNQPSAELGRCIFANT